MAKLEISKLTGATLLQAAREARAERIDVSEIVRVYSGRPGCGCGCKGTYYTDAKNISRVVNIINKSIAKGPEVEFDKRGKAIDVRKGFADGIAYVEGATRYFWAYTKDAG